jgi:ketosteroid isomerase-like protein
VRRKSMDQQTNRNNLEAGWDALAKGEFDQLASYYTEDMLFIIPGQNDVLAGRVAFREVLDNISAALPPGFDIKSIRYCMGDDEIVNIVEWTSDKIPGGTQSAVLFKFNTDGLVTEERWYVDTEQWKAAF